MTVSQPNWEKKWHSISKYHRPGTKRSKTTKIAWHYTGMAEVPAINTWKYFNNHNVYASAHFIVGLEGEIYYAVPMNEIAYTTNAANKYSIGIECATTGSDDHYTEKEYKSMVHLGAYLAEKYNLDPREDFIRHYDVTKKVCPRYFVNNPKAWKQFKQDCYDYMKKDEFKPYIIRVTADTLNGRKGPGMEYDVVTKLYEGTAITIVEENGNWLKAKMGYWIHKNYVEFIRYA